MTSPSLDAEVRELVRLALREDHVTEDITSLALVPEAAHAHARIVCREPGTVAGLFLLEDESPLFEPFPGILIRLHGSEGEAVAAGQLLAELKGPAREILGVERTLLNFLQRMSGIATMTARFVAATAGLPARIQETRKTCPGWRRLDKLAVAAGGGLNHRGHLADQVLIKENHLVFTHGEGRSANAVRAGLEAARQHAKPGAVIEIEVETLDQFRAALGGGPDVIMLDEFSAEDIGRAVEIRNTSGQRTLIEVSGSVTLEAVRALAELGVDRISVGALTHSVLALDLAMEVQPTEPDA